MEVRTYLSIITLNVNGLNAPIQKVLKGKEGHCVMIKGSIQEEGITFINIHATNTGAHKYKENINRQKRKIDSNANSHLYQWIDHPNIKSIRKQWL